LNNKLRGIILLIVGILLILLAAGAVYFLSRQAGGITGLTARPTPVSDLSGRGFVITRDLKLGEVIKDGDLLEVNFPPNLLPRDPVTSINEAIGKFVKADLIQGELLLKHHLADPTNTNHDLAYILDAEHVLMAISIDDVMTHENIIKRGDIIDILVTVKVVVPSPNTVTEQQTGTSIGGQTTLGQTTQDQMNTETIERDFTFDAFQQTDITALVMGVVNENGNTNTNAFSTGSQQEQPVQTKINAYLLALNPQDALVLKHLKDAGGIFDFVLRSPASTLTFDLTPITQEYIIELFGLQILK
jgi:pilus assembly protein CpaB